MLTIASLSKTTINRNLFPLDWEKLEAYDSDWCPVEFYEFKCDFRYKPEIGDIIVGRIIEVKQTCLTPFPGYVQ